MRNRSITFLVAAVTLLAVSIGVAVSDRANRVAAQDQTLGTEAAEQSSTIAGEFARGRSISLMASNNPAFREFYDQLGRKDPTVRTRRGVVEVRVVGEAEGALSYLSQIFPEAIAEVCFLDRSGTELARSVYGKPLPAGKLLPDKSDRPFFAPAFALNRGEVYQAKPFVSKDTKDWVVPTATEVLTRDGRERAIVHFDLQIESFRRAMAKTSGSFRAYVIDGRTGAVVIDSHRRQAKGGALGRPGDRRFTALAGEPLDTGALALAGSRAAFHRVGERSRANANDWYVVVMPASGGAAGFAPALIGLIVLALALLVFGVVNLRRRHGELDVAAHTDVLTGLANRRRLLADLDDRVAAATEEDGLVFVLFDLDGFKAYNDAYGHSAGDALLARLGARLMLAMPEGATAYRLGGDEFCVLARAGADAGLSPVVDAAAALSEHGDGFVVGASYGAVGLPSEATNASAALVLADRRMYAQKSGQRSSAGRQSADVLLRSLQEAQPELHGHAEDVAQLAAAVGRELDLEEGELETLLRAAELHDIGKIALPASILNSPAPLDEAEWAFMRRHTLIGERILNAAPALAGAAELVRSAHERWDGTGYPNRLAGEQIPLGARIIFVCDAYHAMTSDRPYQRAISSEAAMDQLRECAGTQFDPAVVEAFVSVVSGQPAAAPTGD